MSGPEPLALTEKVTVDPIEAVWLTGWDVMTGAVTVGALTTVSVAVLEVTEPAELDTTTE